MATATGSVLLQLNTSLGPGGLSSLKAGVDMFVSLKNQVEEVVKELDEFKTVLARVDMEMVNYADSAAQGQIDTLELMKSLQSLNRAGAKVTEEQFKILAVQAVNLAKSTGQDATEAFTRLTDAISKGQNRALAEYGIKLKTSYDLQKTQTDAINAMTEGYEDLTVAIETDTERMYALGNAWGTAKGLMWDALSGEGGMLSDAIDAVTASLNDLNSYMSTLNDSTKSYLFSVTGAVDTVKTAFAGLFQYMADFHELLGSDDTAKAIRSMSRGILAEIDERRSAEGVDITGTTPVEKPETKGPKNRGGAGGKKRSGEYEVGAMIGLSPAAQRWADTLGVEVTPQTMGWFESFAQRMGGDISMGMEGPAGVQRGGQFGEGDWEKASSSVDEKMAELINLEERREYVQAGAVERLQEYMLLRDEELLSMEELMIHHENRLTLLQDEEYQEARMAEMRESELIYEAEREIHMAYEREKAIEFANQFAITWRQSYRTISAGATAVGHIQDLLKASWGSLITSVIKGTGDWKQALKEVLIAKGIAIAIEEGWLGLSDTVAAISAFARRQYAKGTALLASAAGHYALMGIAGTAAGVASRLGGSGGGAGGASTASYSSTPTFSGGGGSYGGEEKQVTYIIKLDDGAAGSMFKMVKEENTRQKRSGGSSFQDNDEEAA